MNESVAPVFKRCVEAIRGSVLISQVSPTDNEILPRKVPNPGAGRKHVFRAWRLKGSPTAPAIMHNVQSISIEADAIGEADE